MTCVAGEGRRLVDGYPGWVDKRGTAAQTGQATIVGGGGRHASPVLAGPWARPGDEGDSV